MSQAKPEPTPAEGVAAATRAAIAHHVRASRTALGLSARALAEAAGISPALVSQLENAQANPTVEVLSAVAEALGTSLAELARVPASGPVLMRAAEKGSEADQEGRTLLPAQAGRRVELYEMLLPAGGAHHSAPHGVGSEEVAYVVSGAVSVSTDDWSVHLKTGDAVRFGSEVEHSYQVGARPARIVSAVSMPQ